MFKLKLIVIFIFNFYSLISTGIYSWKKENVNCTYSDLVFPCTCKDNLYISCFETNEYFIYLSKIFEEINELKNKEFKHIIISSPDIEVIEENVFHNSTFEELITISGCINLRKIHRNAFSATALVTKKIFIQFNPELKDNSVFEALNQLTAVKEIELSNNGFDEIPSWAFNNSHNSLLKLTISGDSLKTLGQEAFTGLSSLESLIIFDTKLSSNSDFKPISHLKVVKEIVISNNGFTEIPSRAFNKIQTYLRKLTITGPSLTKLGPFAFNGLTNLRRLTIKKTNIDFIPDFAFEFEKFSKYPIFIDLRKNKLGNNSFSTQTFVNIRRPTLLILDDNFKETYTPHDFNKPPIFHYQYLDTFDFLNKTVFLPFLQAHPLNKINMFGVKKFDCDSCKNIWIKEDKMLDRVIKLQCHIGYQISDTNNSTCDQNK